MQVATDTVVNTEPVVIQVECGYCGTVYRKTSWDLDEIHAYEHGTTYPLDECVTCYYENLSNSEAF